MNVGPWIACNKAVDDIDLVAGMQVEIIEHGAPVRYLVGDLNELDGSCDCCRFLGKTTIILRYRQIDLTEDA